MAAMTYNTVKGPMEPTYDQLLTCSLNILLLHTRVHEIYLNSHFLIPQKNGIKQLEKSS